MATEANWDDRCVVCYPEAATPDGEDGFDHFCKQHNPPKEVVIPHLMGEDSEPLEQWIERARADRQQEGDG